MAIKFRKKLKIAPGIKLNITQKGISSVSLGGKGVTLNTGSKKGSTITTSIPGSGLSHTQKISNKSGVRKPKEQDTSSSIGIGGVLLFGVIAIVLLLVIFG